MEKSFVAYNKKLKELSKTLRNNSTLSEVLLWNELKAGKIRGYKFNRQKPLQNYIVDFYCKKLNLIIEIDGDSHIDKYERDMERQNKLEKNGLKFLRFDDMEIKFEMLNVLNTINNYVDNFENVSS